MSKPVVFIMGPSGVGKGVLLEAISKEYDFQPISTGDVLRAEVAKDTELGKKIGEILSRGGLVPPEVAVTLLKQTMDGSKAHGVFLDGFPRSKEQRDAWYAALGAPTGMINLNASEEILTERVLNRAKEAAAAGQAVRADDNLEVLKKRFRTHQEQCEPVVEEERQKLGAAGKFCDIDASKDKQSVRDAAKAFLTKLSISPVQ